MDVYENLQIKPVFKNKIIIYVPVLYLQNKRSIGFDCLGNGAQQRGSGIVGVHQLDYFLLAFCDSKILSMCVASKVYEVHS